MEKEAEDEEKQKYGRSNAMAQYEVSNWADGKMSRIKISEEVWPTTAPKNKSFRSDKWRSVINHSELISENVIIIQDWFETNCYDSPQCKSATDSNRVMSCNAARFSWKWKLHSTCEGLLSLHGLVRIRITCFVILWEIQWFQAGMLWSQGKRRSYLSPHMPGERSLFVLASLDGLNIYSSASSIYEIKALPFHYRRLPIYKRPTYVHTVSCKRSPL